MSPQEFLLQGNEKPIVYFEKFMAIVYMDDLVITRRGCRAKVTPIVEIPRPRPYMLMPKAPWNIGCTWDWLDFDGSYLNARWVGWTIWTDPVFVQAVRTLCDSEDWTQAHELVMDSIWKDDEPSD